MLTALVLAASAVAGPANLPDLPKRGRNFSEIAWINYTTKVLRQTVPTQTALIDRTRFAVYSNPVAIRSLGIAYAVLNPDTGATGINISSVLVAKSRNPREFAFVAAHELGHLAMRHGAESELSKPEREKEADLFAALAVRGGACAALKLEERNIPLKEVLKGVKEGRIPAESFAVWTERMDHVRSLCVQDKAGKLGEAVMERILGGKAEPYYAGRYKEDLNGADPSVFVKLARLARLRKERTDMRDNRVNAQYAGLWRYMLENGADMRFLSGLDEHFLYQLVRGFATGRFDRALIPQLTESPIVNSRKVAESDPEFRLGAAWPRAHLKYNLERRRHVYRTGTDYDESPAVVDEVQDEHILFILRRYLDYLDTPESAAALAAMFPADEPTHEHGGLIFAGRNGGLELKLIPPDPSDVYDREEGYRSPLIEAFAPVLGAFHTHPFEEGRDPREWAGPSGYSRDQGAYDAADTASLRHYSQANQLIVWLVVSALGNGECNVDAFFRDSFPSPVTPGQFRMRPYVTVLDLGIFPCK